MRLWTIQKGEYELSDKEILDGFKMSRFFAWLEFFPVERALTAYIEHESGLNSVCTDENEFEELIRAAKKQFKE